MQVKVWDSSTRLYHWSQAVIFVALVATGFSGNGPHIQLGLILFTLVLWRVLWGMLGSQTSRFQQFVCSPKATWHYLCGKGTDKLGHNPLGAWMVVSLVVILMWQCISGLALAGLLDQLPYANLWLTDGVFDYLEQSHLLLAKLLPLLVVVHLVAILVYKLRGKGLVKAMFTGMQEVDFTMSELQFASQRKAFLVLFAAALVTMTIIAFSIN